MIITFCGHAQFDKSEEAEQKILNFLHEKVGEQFADMYLGGYGEFDHFAYKCCMKFKTTHPNISLVYVTPYLSIEYQQKSLADIKAKYDSVVYPNIEDKPPRFAIVYRNRFMVEAADYVVAYVSHSWGGAYATYKYAQKKEKAYF